MVRWSWCWMRRLSALVNGRVARVPANNGETVDVILENFGFNRMTRAVMSAARREPPK